MRLITQFEDAAAKGRKRKQEGDATQGDHLQAVSMYGACAYPVRLGQRRGRRGERGGGATVGEPQMSSNG